MLRLRLSQRAQCLQELLCIFAHLGAALDSAVETFRGDSFRRGEGSPGDRKDSELVCGAIGGQVNVLVSYSDLDDHRQVAEQGELDTESRRGELCT